jgi:hypothetical protein
MPTLDFLVKLAMGSAMTVLNMAILLLAAVALIRFVDRRSKRHSHHLYNWRLNLETLSVVMGFLFLGHIMQFATWATLFMIIGEFEDFGTAFYHSTVNFTSLGYGDIVMSEDWRLLGALEAANGVLMFGLSAGMFLSVMSRLFQDGQSGAPGA